MCKHLKNLRVLLQILTNRGTGKDISTCKIASYSQRKKVQVPKCFKMFTTRKLKPHKGAVGVPFMKSITLLSWTIYNS